MSSRGVRAAGTDGNDFQNRQRIAQHYQESAQYKSTLKWFFVPHFLVLIFMWMKRPSRFTANEGDAKAFVRLPASYETQRINERSLKLHHGQIGSEVLRINFGWKNAFFARLDMPSAYPWEYVWCFSFVPIVLALFSFQRNKLTFLHYAYYSEFLVGIFPCMIGLGGQLPELLEYVNDMENSNTPTFKGTFPMVIIWYIFFAVALQIHGFSMYFMHNLAAAWAPVKRE